MVPLNLRSQFKSPLISVLSGNCKNVSREISPIILQFNESVIGFFVTTPPFVISIGKNNCSVICSDVFFRFTSRFNPSFSKLHFPLIWFRLDTNPKIEKLPSPKKISFCDLRFKSPSITQL